MKKGDKIVFSIFSCKSEICRFSMAIFTFIILTGKQNSRLEWLKCLRNIFFFTELHINIFWISAKIKISRLHIKLILIEYWWWLSKMQRWQLTFKKMGGGERERDGDTLFILGLRMISIPRVFVWLACLVEDSFQFRPDVFSMSVDEVWTVLDESILALKEKKKNKEKSWHFW